MITNSGGSPTSEVQSGQASCAALQRPAESLAESTQLDTGGAKGGKPGESQQRGELWPME